MKLNTRRTVLIGLAFMSISAFWQLYNYVVPLMLQYTFKLDDGVIGFIMAADNVLALFLLPLFGAISDRTHTPLGRRTPYILGGTLAASVLMILLTVADWNASLPMFVAVLAALLLAMAVYRSPAVALMPDVTPKPLRSKANAIINLMGALGGIFSYIMVWAMLPKIDPVTQTKPASYTTVFAVIAAFMLTAAIVLPLTVRENRLMAEMPPEDEPKQAAENGKMAPEVKRSLIFLLLSVSFWFMAYNAVESAYSRFVLNMWGVDEGVGSTMMIVAMLVATASYVPIGVLSSRIGRKRVILGGVVLLTAMFACGMLLRTYSIFAYALMGLIGVAWASINVNSYPMVVEMSRGSNVGKYTGYYYTFSMSAQVLTPILSGQLFNLFGYTALFPYATAFAALAFFTMTQVRHGDNRPQKAKSALDAFDTPD